MKKNWNTWKCRLTAWIMALLVLLGAVPQDAAVLAAEGSAQAAQQQTITGFAGLSGEQSEIHITGRVSEDRLLAKMPASLEVYLNGSSSRHPFRLPGTVSVITRGRIIIPTVIRRSGIRTPIPWRGAFG